MPAVATLASVTTGHPPFPPTGFTSGDPTVTVNGQPVLTVGSSMIPHTDGESIHGGSIVQGSSVFFVNGKPVAYVGCATSCGDIVATGDPTVTVSG